MDVVYKSSADWRFRAGSGLARRAGPTSRRKKCRAWANNHPTHPGKENCMATFEVVKREELKMIRCEINNESVRAESGALHYMRGKIAIASSPPSVGGFLKSMVTGENIFRPTYTGTVEIFFGPPIFGEYETLDLRGEEW